MGSLREGVYQKKAVYSRAGGSGAASCPCLPLGAKSWDSSSLPETEGQTNRPGIDSSSRSLSGG
ncbi:hypothetical protein GGTG_07521 [Gaeumannomyces tritici R3-111a-1]|uniref:Uncharacterized protein n=1 Tax=Gaeumannomyces tritici (strain R3-111a-1) TaxID=644352 RepID=J3P1X3_GAET3|nr:hypothetical protein GGTG_07521 [Gaeumannomyces tritici R3-111a-1]EJT73665.1 hypothetical protein GGTG_07521 [Gaeumannomyces tritici R3-111a-1]